MFQYLRRFKGQSGLELIASVVLVLLVFSLIFIKISYESVNRGKEEVESKAKMLSKKIAYYLDIVYEEGPGFRINLSIPENINGYDYNVSVDSNYVFLKIFNTTFVYKTQAFNITNKGLSKTKINELYNDRGKVYVKYYD